MLFVVNYSMTEEIFKPLTADPRYQISNLGRVIGIHGRLLKLHSDTKHPYPKFKTSDRSTKFVHRCVAEVFIGPCPDSMFVLHRDGNPSNNCVDNLYYGTAKQNTADSMRHGTFCRKLTPIDKHFIKLLFSAGLCKAEIGRMYNVTRRVIRLVVSG